MSSDGEPRSYRRCTIIFGFLQWFSASAYSVFQENLCLPYGSKFRVAVTPEAYQKENFPCLQICLPDSADFGQYKVLNANNLSDIGIYPA